VSLEYKTAKAATDLIDSLPSGPQWASQVLTHEGYKTTEPIILYYRDAVECVEFLLSNPLFKDSLNFIPVKHYDKDGNRVITEPILAKQAWDIQVSLLIDMDRSTSLKYIYLQDELPAGATRIGICLASDATHLTSGTGDLEAHPLMMSLDNLDSAVRRKSSNHAWMLLALLPKPKFVGLPSTSDTNINRAVEDEVFHKCIRAVISPLCKVEKEGKLMSDSQGNTRICYTTLSMYMVDLPEATRLAGVIRNTSPVTVASSNQLGDEYRHKRRWWAVTKKQLSQTTSQVSPVDDMKGFVKLCYGNRLTAATHLIWDDWKLCDPSVALGFDILHSGHKFWKDHIFQWCMMALGSEELDFRYKTLAPRIGWRHFSKGVTTLSKSGGRDHRDMQRYILCVIDGSVPSQLATLVRSQLEYHYLAQHVEISEPELKRILQLIKEFHSVKEIVHEKGYRVTKGWKIPKLELQHHIVPSVMSLGNLMGVSTDISEHEHVQLVKEPFRRTNHKEFYQQMVKHLDRLERVRYFDLATTLASIPNSETLQTLSSFDASRQQEMDPDGSLNLDSLATVQNLQGAKRTGYTDYFTILGILDSDSLSQKQRSRIRTFSVSPFTAIHLKRDPEVNKMSIDEAAKQFNLPDLHESIEDFFYFLSHPHTSQGSILQRRPTTARQGYTPINFESIKIWHSVKVQTRSVLQPGKSNKPATICAMPPTDQTKGWVFGRCDFALFINDKEREFRGKANLEGASRLTVIISPGINSTLFTLRSFCRSAATHIPTNNTFCWTTSKGALLGLCSTSRLCSP
jgi:hypothetical protein